LPIQRPTWLPSYLPELDGLRGLAILGWSSITAIRALKARGLLRQRCGDGRGSFSSFPLSGFLITSILLVTRDKPHYFHNFHARRALRIWPVYVLVLAVVYLNAPWFIGPPVWQAVKAAPWLAYIFFVQNLFHLTLPPASVPHGRWPSRSSITFSGRRWCAFCAGPGCWPRCWAPCWWLRRCCATQISPG
jgi:peptidoglycan/LPS O-acetylase OafA/YrhL